MLFFQQENSFQNTYLNGKLELVITVVRLSYRNTEHKLERSNLYTL